MLTANLRSHLIWFNEGLLGLATCRSGSGGRLEAGQGRGRAGHQAPQPLPPLLPPPPCPGSCGCGALPRTSLHPGDGRGRAGVPAGGGPSHPGSLLSPVRRRVRWRGRRRRGSGLLWQRRKSQLLRCCEHLAHAHFYLTVNLQGLRCSLAPLLAPLPSYPHLPCLTFPSPSSFLPDLSLSSSFPSSHEL